MNGYRHIIWDWNGTLFDDAWLCIEIINVLLAKRRMKLVDGDSYQRAFTFPIKNFYANVGFDFKKEPYESLAAEFMKLYDERRFECELQPLANETLQAFAERGCMQSVLSATEQTRLDEIIDYLELGRFFSHSIGTNDYYAVGKVNQGRQLLEELKYHPSEVVLIGDTLHDAEVAAAMGVDCILLPCGHFPREKLHDSEARVVESLAEIFLLSPVV